MPPAKSFATTLSYELSKHDDREAVAGRQDKQSITSLYAINNQLGFASSRFLCCADPNHYFSPTEHSFVKVLKEKTEVWWKPVRIQDNCSPGTGETLKTDQVRTDFHSWCMREEQIASSKPLYNRSAVSTSFPQQVIYQSENYQSGKLPILITTYIDYFGYGLLVSGCPSGEKGRARNTKSKWSQRENETIGIRQ